MSDLHLSGLKVSGFRGIRDTVELSLGRRLTIIYGGNASGKSSVAQAIEFALSGQVLDQENRPIAVPYLSHARSAIDGRVTLFLNNGPEEYLLQAAVGENQSEIEARFRKIGAVDWPDRQNLPVTHTHITSQGMLARVLAADSVTRNDLSGLCAGAYLRSLLTRAEKLADYFRQGATGRNIQSDLKAARTALDAARVLHQSLTSSTDSSDDLNTDSEQLLNRLAVEANLPATGGIDAIVRAMDDRLAQADQRLLSIQRLLVRTRDLGQYEVELSQAREQIDSATETESKVLAKQTEINAILSIRQQEQNAAATKREQANDTLVASERYHRSSSLIESLRGQQDQSRQFLAALTEQIGSLDSALQGAIVEQREKSDALVRLTSDHSTAVSQLSTVIDSHQRLSSVPEDALIAQESRLRECERNLKEVNELQTAVAIELQRAISEVGLTEAAFREISENDARFSSAASELEALIIDDGCTLCGHHHGTRRALEEAIKAVRDQRLSGTSAQRLEYERANANRRDKAAAYAQAQSQVQLAEATLVEVRRDFDRLKRQREATVSFARESLTRQGLHLEVSERGMVALRDLLRTKVSQLQQETDSARLVEEDARQRRDDLEQEMAARRASAEQFSRLARELHGQIEAAHAAQPAPVSLELVSSARLAVTEAESALAALQHAIGRIRADSAEQERQLGEARAQKAGAQRRLLSVEGLLGALDEELTQVGATRDIANLIALEGATRQQRDQFDALRARALQVREELTQIARNQARIAASEQLRTAQTKLDQLQRRQERLGKRAKQFAELKNCLEVAQSTTAEEVLKNVRIPVGMMFRAMTAGCQWDIKFSLVESGGVEASLTDGSGISVPATSMLNSAYLNVAAIALRIALASQQNWTSLRTIILDDPILEMDSLTQSAFVDGLEAIIASTCSPWTSLQLVITTWSEDFAVLAAHKLAHLNADAKDSDDFVIYRLGARPDGTVVPERHTPRWKSQANAA